MQIPRRSALRALSCALAVSAFCPFAEAAGYRQLYAFQGAPNDGASPISGLLSYKGDFYGTAGAGGGSTCSGGGCGTIFKMTPAGAETTLYSFTGGKDGFFPGGPLVADKSGNLYATTEYGGSGNCTSSCGTVVKLAPDGALTVLHTFGSGNDGDDPEAGVITDAKGNLYGNTGFGGGGSCTISESPPGCGTLFKVSANGKEKVLYSFQNNGADGIEPTAVLFRDRAGDLFGTTIAGGTGTACGTGVGCGTVFELDADGMEKVLYSFCRKSGCPDGAFPISGPLIADANGNLYGTTYEGGTNGTGAVFKLAPDGTETVLHSFCALKNCVDGSEPRAGVISDNTGNLYGTTLQGGETGIGVVFRLAPDGTETVLHAFSGGTDGYNPSDGLIADKAGDLYGDTQSGGIDNCNGSCGTVFRMKE